ncbi:MAG TPA: TIGR03067 domain-containing protein [Pirellula sp.]|nr:TIGR03067 domain-containing protein [Pirellula sp.]
MPECNLITSVILKGKQDDSKKIAFEYSAIILFLSNPSITAESKEMKELAGEWECISAVDDGKEIDEATVKKLRLTLTKDGAYKTTLGDRVLFDSTCKIDNAKTPKSIDMIGTEGENKGKAAQGIYKLVEGKLSICYTMPGKQRPSDFKSESGSSATLVRWQRKKR